MKAELRDLHSPDIDLQTYWPEDPADFGFLLQAAIGAYGEQGEDSFSFMVCSPAWMARNYSGRVTFGYHHIIVTEYDLAAIRAHLTRICERTVGENWLEIATKLSKFGRWDAERNTL